MTDFKVGDRVEVIAAEDSNGYENGDTGTIASVRSGGFQITFDHGKTAYVYTAEVTLLAPAPDVITIDRADLPEVSEDSNGSFIVRPNGITYPGAHTAVSARNGALDYLALAEYLEAREKAGKEAAEQRAAIEAKQHQDARRNKLAQDIARDADWNDWKNATFYSHQTETQEAIKRIIKAQDAPN